MQCLQNPGCHGSCGEYLLRALRPPLEQLVKEAGKGYWEEGPASTRAWDDYGIVLVEIKAESKDWRMGCKGPQHWSMCVVSTLKRRWP